MTFGGRARNPSCAAAAFLAAALLGSAAIAADEEAAAPVQERTAPATTAAPTAKRAQLASEEASREVRVIADWVVDSNDHRDRPFIIVDKPHAKVFAFDSAGRLLGAAPALLGLAIGDRMVAAGGGERESSELRTQDKVTPAGRFWAQLGRSARGEDVLWVDYDTGLSLHRVLTTKPEERRLQRLKTQKVSDNRISAGCINVPKEFYEKVVAPAFQSLVGVVYILPDAGSARELLKAYNVDDPPELRKTATEGATQDKQ
jgi:hypothetical protein